ncbi:hypothetical protein EBZ80_26475 [bacterium]|nr:hypothetical protein [bacterium]
MMGSKSQTSKPFSWKGWTGIALALLGSSHAAAESTGRTRAEVNQEVVRTYADVLHSVDRASLVDALASGDPSSRKHERLDCFVQMNLTSDGGRGGASDESDMLALADRVSSEESLNLLGIMAVAPLDEEPASAFARVHAASERLAQVHPAARSISMGMSHDFRQAIAHGATHLRIGTAITGSRPIQG